MSLNKGLNKGLGTYFVPARENFTTLGLEFHTKNTEER